MKVILIILLFKIYSNRSSLLSTWTINYWNNFILSFVIIFSRGQSTIGENIQVLACYYTIHPKTIFYTHAAVYFHLSSLVYITCAELSINLSKEQELKVTLIILLFKIYSNRSSLLHLSTWINYWNNFILSFVTILPIFCCGQRTIGVNIQVRPNLLY